MIYQPRLETNHPRGSFLEGGLSSANDLMGFGLMEFTHCDEYIFQSSYIASSKKHMTYSFSHAEHNNDSKYEHDDNPVFPT